MALPIVAQEFKIGAVAGLNLNVPSDLESGLGFRVGVKGADLSCNKLPLCHSNQRTPGIFLRHRRRVQTGNPF